VVCLISPLCRCIADASRLLTTILSTPSCSFLLEGCFCLRIFSTSKLNCSKINSGCLATINRYHVANEPKLIPVEIVRCIAIKSRLSLPHSIERLSSPPISCCTAKMILCDDHQQLSQKSSPTFRWEHLRDRYNSINSFTSIGSVN
jgi:hypothetical protein